ncbi:hypothetical protein A3Q56_04762 [Intoshia linei]|uniref:Uncharacterized protein n=1 Tax=Intoshia linei TaxID=1819745 RepID=A0A177B1H4_9BILA|nr:hypothetical protein A3Q56_04762 [Intoshia linei]
MDSMRDGSENEGSSSLVFSEIYKNEDLSEYVSLFAKKENTLRENFNKIYETDTNHLQEIIYKLKETVQKQSQQIVEDNIKLSSLTKLQYENTEYIEQLLCLNQKCDFLENQNKQSYNDKIELGSEITSLKNDLIEKQHHNQELTNAIICYKEQINNLVSEIESYAKLKLEQEHNETNKEDHCLKLTLNAYRKENIEMSNKIKDFNQDLNTIRQEKDKIVKDNLRLIRLYTQQNDMIEDLEKLQVETKNDDTYDSNLIEDYSILNYKIYNVNRKWHYHNVTQNVKQTFNFNFSLKINNNCTKLKIPYTTSSKWLSQDYTSENGKGSFLNIKKTERSIWFQMKSGIKY